MEDRLLTSEQNDEYTTRLAAAGFTFVIAGGGEPYGFDVTDGAITYNYRYDGASTTAVDLMERICAERDC